MDCEGLLNFIKNAKWLIPPPHRPFIFKKIRGQKKYYKGLKI